MPRKSFTELSNELLTFFPDNVVGAVTPAVLRNYFNNFLQAIRPSYGILARTTPNPQTLGLTDTPLVMETGAVSDVPDYTATPATGTLTRLEAGTTRFTFSTAIDGTSGRIVTATLYKNGVPTAWRVSGTLGGAGKPVDVSLSALEYTAGSAAYQIQVKSDTAGTSVTFSNADMIAETVPVNTY